MRYRFWGEIARSVLIGCCNEQQYDRLGGAEFAVGAPVEIDSTCMTASLFGFYILAVILGILLFHDIIGYIIVLDDIHEFITLG